MSNKIQLKIATPEKLILEESVDQVSIPTTKGEITVLPNHISLISQLAFGELLAIKGEEDIPFAIWGGVVEISNNNIVILTDIAEYADELEEDKIEQARKEAEDLLAKKGEYTTEEYSDLKFRYEQQLARLKVARKFKRKKYRKIPSLNGKS